MPCAQVHGEDRPKTGPGGDAKEIGRHEGIAEGGLQDRPARGERAANEDRGDDPGEAPVKHDVLIYRIGKVEGERRPAEEERNGRRGSKESKGDKNPHGIPRISSRPHCRRRTIPCSCRSPREAS